MRGIQKQAFLTIKIVVVLTLGLGLAGWYGLYQTSLTITDFEAKNLPEVSTALGLSEDVASLAAFAPYVSSSAKPFQLQSERKRLETRFTDLVELAKTIKEPEFRRDLLIRLSRLHQSIAELIERIEEELFLREDLLSARFVLSELESQQESEIRTKEIHWKVIPLLRFVLDQEVSPLLSQKKLLGIALGSLDTRENLSEAEGSLRKLADKIIKTRSRIHTINQRKTYLLALIRAQSEQLTKQVNVFVGQLQADVVLQRERVQSTVADANILMLGVAFLLILGLWNHYRFNDRMTRDLSTVTQDMLKLASGDVKTAQVAFQREDEIGELARAYEVFRDHSLKVQEVSEDLSKQKELLETVFNHINDGLSVFSPQDELLSWNKQFMEIFNFKNEEVFVTQSLGDLQALMAREPHEYRTLSNDPVDIEMVNKLRHNQPFMFERRYVSGKVVEFRSQPMPDGGFVTLYSNLTDRKAVESQLHQAQKMEMLGQLTGGVAHDFNNLLAAVLANLQLLYSSDGLNNKQEKYVERSLNITEKGAALVQRLLAFSRKQQLYPQRLNVDDLIQGIIDLIEYSIAPNIKISLELGVSENVYVDPSQLENALLNLAINSSVAMPSGGELVFKTELCTNKESEIDFVAILVEDTGHGIPLDIQERVLEPFFTTRPAGRGSGLGLSMVYGFVTQSGGEMRIESSPDDGTKITLLLPMFASNHNSLANLSPPFINPILIPEGKKILLVEDNSQVRQVMSEQIESIGFQTIPVASAEAALEDLEEDPEQIAMVLTDISLAGTLSGVDLKTRVAKQWPDIPVVMTSGLPRDNLKQYYNLKPTELVIPKPISFSTLKQLLGS